MMNGIRVRYRRYKQIIRGVWENGAAENASRQQGASAIFVVAPERILESHCRNQAGFHQVLLEVKDADSHIHCQNLAGKSLHDW
jgi:hypothetical protein